MVQGEKMNKKMQKILVLLVIGCVLTFTVLQLRCSFEDSSLPLNKREGRGHVFHRGISYLISLVQILGYDYQPDDRVESRLTSDVVKYVLIVSRKLTSELKAEGVGKLTEEDQQALRKLTKFLDSHSEYNGATGITTRRRGEGFDRIRESLEQSSYRFLVKNWTIIIRNSGQIHQDTNDVSQSGWYQECNIAERVFRLRKEVFLSLRWRAESGSMSHLDFFVRSNEALKLPKLSECFFLSELSYSDRGILEGTRDFIDYSTLGQLHNILRIVRPDIIEWTKCADGKQFCPEAPLSSRSNTEVEGDVVMDDILAATVDAMNLVGIDYRVVYELLWHAPRCREKSSAYPVLGRR